MSKSRHAGSRTTRGTLYCGLYSAAAAAKDEDDDDDDDDVTRRLRWSKEPRST